METGVELDYDAAGVAHGRQLVDELGIDRAVADIGSAADAIRSAGRIGVVGHCWGGTVAMLAAMRLGLPAVSYYGARNVAHLDEPPKAPLQFHFGELDASIPPAAVQRHRDALPDAEVHIYPAGHGFHCDRRKDYDAASARKALERTLAFFTRTLEAP
jgi:carboxymethylenebutenolidase